MLQALVRYLLQLGIVLGAIALYVAQSRVEAAMLFIYPMVLWLPGLLASLLVLAPLEHVLDRRGAGALIYVAGPFVGALLPWLTFPLAGNTDNFLNAVWMLMPVGAIWGLLWAITRPVGRWLFGRKAAGRTD